MNEDIINDLKQFISATVSQATAHLATKDDLENLESRFSQLEHRMDKRFDDLDLKFSTIADAHAEMPEDHDNRIKKLATQPV